MDFDKFTRRIQGILTKPSETFKEIGRDKPFWQGIILLVITFIFAFGFDFIRGILTSLLGIELIIYNQIPLTYGEIPRFILGPVVMPFVIFTLALISLVILHLFVKLFGGVADLKSTVCVFTFAYVPVMIFLIIDSLLPLISGGFKEIHLIGYILLQIAEVYSIALLVIGISAVHKISKLNAFMAVFIIPLILSILIKLGVLRWLKSQYLV